MKYSSEQLKAAMISDLESNGKIEDTFLEDIAKKYSVSLCEVECCSIDMMEGMEYNCDSCPEDFQDYAEEGTARNIWESLVEESIASRI